MRNIFFHPEAEEEMKASAVFYETKVNGLGDKFLDEIEHALEKISVSPEVWPIYFENIRHFLLRRFPFAMLYEIIGDSIYVISVMHLKRKPFYWKVRLN